MSYNLEISCNVQRKIKHICVTSFLIVVASCANTAQANPRQDDTCFYFPAVDNPRDLVAADYGYTYGFFGPDFNESKRQRCFTYLQNRLPAGRKSIFVEADKIYADYDTGDKFHPDSSLTGPFNGDRVAAFETWMSRFSQNGYHVYLVLLNGPSKRYLDMVPPTRPIPLNNPILLHAQQFINWANSKRTGSDPYLRNLCIDYVLACETPGQGSYWTREVRNGVLTDVLKSFVFPSDVANDLILPIRKYLYDTRYFVPRSLGAHQGGTSYSFPLNADFLAYEFSWFPGETRFNISPNDLETEAGNVGNQLRGIWKPIHYLEYRIFCDKQNSIDLSRRLHSMFPNDFRTDVYPPLHVLGIGGPTYY